MLSLLFVIKVRVKAWLVRTEAVTEFRTYSLNPPPTASACLTNLLGAIYYGKYLFGPDFGVFHGGLAAEREHLVV